MKQVLMMILVLATMNLQAGESDQLEGVRQAFSKFMPGAKVDSVRESEIAGLYEVAIGPRIYYVSKNGRYLVRGHLIDLEKRADLTEARLGDARKKALNSVSEDEMIIFSPKKPKHTITVFTDIDCGYCRRLHSQIDEYLKRGIRVRYMFYPRAGKGSDSYKKAIAVWCSKDHQKALTEAKQGQPIEMKSCKNPVDKHMALANQFGVTGTPMIVTDRGEVLPGYVPPETLERYLNGQ